jgi:hypothetical protein
MERVTGYVEGRHFRIGDLYAFGIILVLESSSQRIERASFVVVAAISAITTMLDLVLFGSAWRIMPDLNDQAGFIGELSERRLPMPQE